MNERNQPTMPARMKIVSETTGFVESKGSRGNCFEWYQLSSSGEWKPSHILHEENWLLTTAADFQRVAAEIGPLPSVLADS